MKKYRSSIIMLLVAFVLAVIWGYFADLKNGEYGSFIGRIIFVPLFLLLWNTIFSKKTTDSKSLS